MPSVIALLPVLVKLTEMKKSPRELHYLQNFYSTIDDYFKVVGYSSNLHTKIEKKR